MLDHIFNLGPYSGFIWPAYGVSALALIGATIWTLSAWYAAKRRLAALQDRQTREQAP